eukprot:CAMPEP_0194772092 /NCGR_PEP_ID=MMETSP0323_2-20130528/50994_1 /TAXON_ID=2866 ORGANISM="Crypthecodinium cohnii, Strain Seligo" /NCGR_SAMPLE_ID=MMETSP0323_2 /ASSEMBLY_ACC=CAM_ASM_000346 /LENGTH=53 /DNA_ID=CAMNT_0039706487 /DNA_START=84 /DNA_END=242 /DNA_ORIENTATION=+
MSCKEDIASPLMRVSETKFESTKCFKKCKTNSIPGPSLRWVPMAKSDRFKRVS